LYQRPATELLSKILAGNSVFRAEPDNVLLTLLKVYAGEPCLKELDGLKFNLTPVGDHNNFRLRWLTTLILTNVLLPKGPSAQKDKPANFFEIKHLTEASTKYVRQLLQANDWKGALTIAMLLPQSHSVLMQRIVFEILMKHAAALAEPSNYAFVTEKLGIEKQWLAVALAMYKQNRGMFESAI
jgi:hypothetical protein